MWEVVTVAQVGMVATAGMEALEEVGSVEVQLLAPVIGGVVQPTVSIVLGTLLATTINALRVRQVNIRAAINKEASDLRSMESALVHLFAGDENAGERQTYLNSLRQYTNRVIIESRTGARSRPPAWSWQSWSWGDGGGLSSSTESELDGILRAVHRRTGSSTCPASPTTFTST